MRTECPDGTWIDDESLAYYSGSLRQSRRRALVRCPDGKLRTVRCGIPDTFFSIPASLSFKGTRVAGYVASTETGVEFRPYLYRKNAALFADCEM